MGIGMKIIQILLSVFSAAVGLFIFFKPALAIEIQKRFYAKINWRIEPISMQKELRNTRIMGIFLFALTVATLVFMSR